MVTLVKHDLEFILKQIKIAEAHASDGDLAALVAGNKGNDGLSNTITIEGTSGDDMVDITSLGAAHRIVFRSNGGNDILIGALRPQDVIALPAGTTIADYEVSISETGQTTLVGDDYSMTFTALDGMPRFAEQGYDPDSDDDDPYLPAGDDDSDDVDAPGGSAGGHASVGTAGDDVVIGTADDDTILEFAGNDSALGGTGRDILRGGDGDNYLSGEGDDMV